MVFNYILHEDSQKVLPLTNRKAGWKNIIIFLCLCTICMCRLHAADSSRADFFAAETGPGDKGASHIHGAERAETGGTEKTVASADTG